MSCVHDVCKECVVSHCVLLCVSMLPLRGSQWAQDPHPLNSYSKDYDPEDWLQVDGATGQIQTQRVLSPTSPFLKDGWYRAIVLALDDGERPVSRGWSGVDGVGVNPPTAGPAGSPPRTATGTLSVEILEVNDHAPALAPPPALSLCSEPDRGPGLLLGATDQDLPPHGAPFRFHLSPAEPALDLNWSLSYVNGACNPGLGWAGGETEAWPR